MDTRGKDMSGANDMSIIGVSTRPLFGWDDECGVVWCSMSTWEGECVRFRWFREQREKCVQRERGREECIEDGVDGGWFITRRRREGGSIRATTGRLRHTRYSHWGRKRLSLC